MIEVPVQGEILERISYKKSLVILDKERSKKGPVTLEPLVMLYQGEIKERIIYMVPGHAGQVDI